MSTDPNLASPAKVLSLSKLVSVLEGAVVNSVSTPPELICELALSTPSVSQLVSP